MTNQQHPITPPPELWGHWHEVSRGRVSELATQAAQWGADQELEACCEWLAKPEVALTGKGPNDLRDARRPNPRSLKKQALKELAWVAKHFDMPLHNRCNAIHTIHRALEQLND
jgi:hypothetical protein